MTDKITLTASSLGKRYKSRQVVKDVSVHITNGEVVGLLGPNGAGKTTIFYMLIGLVVPNRGNIILQNNNITKLTMHKRARLGIRYLPQEKSIFRKLTVTDNNLAVLQLRKDLNRAQKQQKLNDLLEELN